MPFGRALACATLSSRLLANSYLRKGFGRVARETITKLIDDLDGSEAHETVRFGLDGHSYEIDLSTKNATKLRNALAPYIEKGTRVSTHTSGRGGGRGRASAGSERDLNKVIRAWAQRKGYEVAPRGRLKQEIVDLYYREVGR